MRRAWRARPPVLDRGDRRRYRGTLAALFLGTTAFAFQQTAVLPALPTIERDLQAPGPWVAWLLSAYLVIASITAPLVGKLGDRHGKRRLLVVALGCFLVGSVGAALAPSIGVLIFFRSLQGVGGAVFPLSQSVVRDEFPTGEVHVGMGWLTGAFGVGGVLGLGGTGLIVEVLSWRFVFVAGAVVVLAAVALVRLLVPRSPVHNPGRLDAPGAALLAAWLGLALVALTQGDEWGWGSARTVGLFAAAVALLVGWTAHELHAEEPLVDLRALAERPVLFANLATFLLGYVLFGTLFLVPHLVEAPARTGYGFGASALETGLYLLPSAAGQVLAGPVSGLLARRRGPKLPFAAGMALAAASAGLLAVWHDRPWQVVAGMLLLGLGIGFSIGPASALVARAVRSTESGIATALNSVTRRVGGAVGGQAAAALLAALTVGGSAAPPERAFAVALGVSAAVALAGTVCAVLVPGAAGRPG